MTNKQGITITAEGKRTTGIKQFFTELPDYIIPVQKVVPPYMSYTAGYGYQGVLLLDTDKDRVQCHVCGRWYKALGRHLVVHNMDAQEYKDMVGLYRSEPLMSLKTMYKFRHAVKNKSVKNLNKGKDHLFTSESKPSAANGSKTIQWQNRYGTCQAQLRFRLEEAIKKYGRVPTTEEEPTLANIFSRRFGSWTVGLAEYGYTPIKMPNGYSREARLEKERMIAPHCQTCNSIIERKEFSSGLEDKVKWLNKKTCSSECLKKYNDAKVSFRGCLVSDCPNVHKAKGYCMSHYLQNYKPTRPH